MIQIANLQNRLPSHWEEKMAGKEFNLFLASGRGLILFTKAKGMLYPS